MPGGVLHLGHAALGPVGITRGMHSPEIELRLSAGMLRMERSVCSPR